MAGGVRVDKWLWSVRLFKTRTAANKACEQGKVSIGSSADDAEIAKAARRVDVGDHVTIRRGRGVVTVVEVVDLLEKRVGAKVAVEAYVDHSPPPEPQLDAFGKEYLPQATREAGSGRPTKRDRRQIDRLRDHRTDSG
ncbi:MAG: RNA-binding S4 domain-containing protein [Acidimicrobiales bacterium]|nr:RNA-binding S4 domain-containing protein [Acidimicrobiales bacterium]